MILRSGVGHRKVSNSFCRKWFSYQISISLWNWGTQSIKNVVAAGLGVTIISALTVRKENEEKILKAIKIKDCYMGRPLNILTNANNAKTKEEHFLIDFLHNKDMLEKALHMDCVGEDFAAEFLSR